MNIGKSLSTLLEDRGIMKKKIAEVLSCTPQTVSNLLKAEHCTSDQLQKLAEFFGMSIPEFIEVAKESNSDSAA